MKINIEHQVGDEPLTAEEEALFCRWAESVYRERVKQVAKWGDQRHPDGVGLMFKGLSDHYRQVCQSAFARGYGTWSDILLEEVYEMLDTDEISRERQVPAMNAEAVQAAAVLAAWWSDTQRRTE